MTAPNALPHDVRQQKTRTRQVAELVRHLAARLTDWNKPRVANGG